MKRYFRLILLILLVVAFSCEDQPFIVPCDDCTPDEPVTAELMARLDPSYYNNAVVQIWEGNLEDSIMFGTYTPNSETFTETVALNVQYTVTATYHISNDIYVAVDSATPRVKYEKSQCDDACFYIYDRKCDLRLKYTK